MWLRIRTLRLHRLRIQTAAALTAARLAHAPDAEGKGGFVTGGYLALQIRHPSHWLILTFREYILRDIVPHFRNLNERADQIGSEYYERAVSKPADEDFDGDLSGFAEDAHDHALSWYEMMRSLRQTMLNLLAAGLFDLAEQQLAVVGQDAGFQDRQPKNTKLEDLEKWYKSTLRIDLRGLSGWPLMDELRLVANTTKHAEGKTLAASSEAFALIYSPTQRWLECLWVARSKIGSRTAPFPRLSRAKVYS